MDFERPIIRNEKPDAGDTSVWFRVRHIASVSMPVATSVNVIVAPLNVQVISMPADGRAMPIEVRVVVPNRGTIDVVARVHGCVVRHMVRMHDVTDSEVPMVASAMPMIVCRS